MSQKTIFHAALDAAIILVYVWGVALFMTHVETIFGSSEPKTVLVPIIMLLLFVVSAAVTGFFVIGRPILLYLDGHKKESFRLFAGTIGFLILFWALLLLFIA